MCHMHSEGGSVETLGYESGHFCRFVSFLHLSWNLRKEPIPTRLRVNVLQKTMHVLCRCMFERIPSEEPLPFRTFS